MSKPETFSATLSEEEKERRVEGASAGELISQVSQDISLLMRQEVELAKAEIREEASKASKAAGMLGGGGVAGGLCLLFLSVTLMFLLAEVMAFQWAALIVTVVWAIASMVLLSKGRTEVKKVHPPRQTIETLKEIV